MNIAESAKSIRRAIMKLPKVARVDMERRMFVSIKLRPIRGAVTAGLKIVIMPIVMPTSIKNPSHMKRRRLMFQCTEKKLFISKIVWRKLMLMYIRNTVNTCRCFFDCDILIHDRPAHAHNIF